MILTRLLGGLGNQLFQYAAGMRLARARGTTLKLDLSGLDDPGCKVQRAYELDAFRIRAEIATPAEVAAAEQASPAWLRWLGRGRPGVFRERQFHFDPHVLGLPDGTCLNGYWQTERYFADAGDTLREELAFAKPPEGRNAELAAEIAGCHAVSLHVRRGDYLTDPAVYAMHGVCGPDYYQRAVEAIAERVSDPVFFVFSDEPQWARAHLDLGTAAVVVDHNGADGAAEDLRLMSLCAHHVLANSTFSWWGAWLDPRPEKTVVAPEPWFRDAPHDTRDLVPASWLRR